MRRYLLICYDRELGLQKRRSRAHADRGSLPAKVIGEPFCDHVNAATAARLRNERNASVTYEAVDMDRVPLVFALERVPALVGD